MNAATDLKRTPQPSGGRGKTQCARAIAKYIEAGHGTSKYLSTGNIDALKAV